MQRAIFSLTSPRLLKTMIHKKIIENTGKDLTEKADPLLREMGDVCGELSDWGFSGPTLTRTVGFPRVLNQQTGPGTIQEGDRLPSSPTAKCHRSPCTDNESLLFSLSSGCQSLTGYRGRRYVGGDRLRSRRTVGRPTLMTSCLQKGMTFFWNCPFSFSTYSSGLEFTNSGLMNSCANGKGIPSPRLVTLGYGFRVSF